MNAAMERSVTSEDRLVAEPFDYESIPAGYYDHVFKRGSGIQSKWHHLKFRRVIEELRGARRVLDVGCGPGTLLGMLGPEYESVGVDLSQRQIEYARDVYGAPGRSFYCASPAEIADQVEPFDALTAVELIEHLEPRVVDEILAQAFELLKPGGKLVLTTPNFHSAWPVIEDLVNRFGEVKYHFQHINKFTRQGLTRLLEAHSLDDIRVESYLFASPFAAALGWQLADTVARWEQRGVERRAGMLLMGTATKPR